MTSTIYRLKPEHANTRDVLKSVRHALMWGAEQWDTVIPDLTTDIERRRTKPYVAPGVRGEDTETRYVFGIGTPVRATLIGHYVVGSGEIMLCMPRDYRSWDTANMYDRLRVSVRDSILLGMHGNPLRITDPMDTGRKLF